MSEIKTKEKSLVRDMSNMALLNTSKDEYIMYKERRTQSVQVRKELDTVKQEMNEIKIMMTQILEKVSG